jgi:16S rRNA (guanine527-N7)-methyltransferase
MQPEFLFSWDSVPHETKAKLDAYEGLLQKWQSKINLVGPSTIKDARIRHFADSLQIASCIPVSAKVLYDLGSGAGFPGLVLAMARPDLTVHLIESDQRKAAFLQTVSRETATPVTLHIRRIEQVDLPPPDVITARALASLSELLRLSECWWSRRPDCVLIFPKGAAAEEEIDAALEKYEFDQCSTPSKTDSKAKILCLTKVRNKCE